LDKEAQLIALKKCIRKGLSVRQMEAYARKLAAGVEVGPEVEEEYPESYSRLVEELERVLSDNFSIKRTNSGGSRITIECANDEELERLIERLGRVK
jgi:ParB family chromosome partitioning protein